MALKASKDPQTPHNPKDLKHELLKTLPDGALPAHLSRLARVQPDRGRTVSGVLKI